MKFVKSTRMVVLCLALCSPYCFAEATTPRIGIVDKQVLGEKSQFAKNAFEKMKSDFSARQDSLVAKEKNLMTKYEELERNKDVISEAERTKKEKELAKMQQELKDGSETFQADVMQRQEKEGSKFEDLVSGVLADIAKEEKLEMILNQQAVLYGGKQMDYTNKALQLLDKRYKEAKK